MRTLLEPSAFLCAHDASTTLQTCTSESVCPAHTAWHSSLSQKKKKKACCLSMFFRPPSSTFSFCLPTKCQNQRTAGFLPRAKASEVARLFADGRTSLVLSLCISSAVCTLVCV
uniref:Uncharacterized protein n=1 Tax=Anguilla anguilla TaxID=7936 RepID=A0A0E9WXS5_ANGAN